MENLEIWQNLIAKALQPGIIYKIKLYAGILGDISKTLSDNINKHLIIKSWFEQINVQTSFDEITEKDIKLLWALYIKRIANAPAKNLLEKAIAEGLNQYIFRSRVFVFDKILTEEYINKMKNLVYSTDLEDQELKLDFLEGFNKLFSNKKMRKGDALCLTNDSTFFIPEIIYDGTKYVYMENMNIRRIANIPKTIIINNFPTTDYFTRNNYIADKIYFDTTETKVQLIEEYHSLKGNIYKYLTIGKYSDYTIWSHMLFTDKNWTSILSLYGVDLNIREVVYNITEMFNTSENKEMGNKIIEDIKNSQSLRVLFTYELIYG
jgi:hypothetical protein